MRESGETWAIIIYMVTMMAARKDWKREERVGERRKVRGKGGGGER